jgi:hypothetical protein
VPTKRQKPSTTDLELEVQDYLQARSMRERSEYREKKGKEALMETLEKVGEVQDGGHRILMLNDPIPYAEYKGGKAKDRKVAAIRRVRRSSQKLDSERAKKLLMRKGMWAECTITEVVINEDALVAAIFEGRITDKEAATLYEESESFAFYLVDDDAIDE